MPYKNIVFVKLEKRLLNDPRFFGMSENAQLVYLKLMMIAAETYNRIPLEIGLVTQLLRTNLRKSTIDKAIKEVLQSFPKFKKSADFYYFEDFESKTNYRRDFPSDSEGMPKVVVDKEKDKEKDKESGNSPLGPSMQEVIKEFASQGFDETNAKTFYSYYKTNDWKTKGGVSILKNWNHKIIGWMNNQKQYNYEKTSNVFIKKEDERFEKPIRGLN